MRALLPRLPRRPGPELRVPARGLLEARVPWVRDRALDHVVERERHLVPFLLAKDALLSAAPPPHAVPLHSLPSTIPFPFRPLRFLRLYPSAFALSPHPVAVSPTPRLAGIHSAEAQVLDSTRADAADRLLRLLMLAPARALPLHLVARLRLDLGLAPDFPRSLLPNYPDYFALSRDGALLELVCYRKDLAVSAMQSYAQRTGGYKVGDAVPFPLSFPRGFELDKKVRKWLDDWQRLPYISPYEDGSHLTPRSDITEKRTAAVLHEVLSLTVGKKMEKEVLVKLGEALRLPPGFRKVLARHPGIFYLSHKLRTQTVVLRESFRRHMLVDKHPMMGIRYQYLHLMHMGQEEAGKCKGKGRKTVRGEQMIGEEFGAEGENDDEEDEEYDDEEEEEDMEAGVASGDEDSDDDDDDDDDEEGEKEDMEAGVASGDEDSDDEDADDTDHAAKG
ncbi:protein WHAT'S THIS FACTOR 9, mitochondrial-like [Oryza glaberrima]|uniref:protein WHAT'S THIS FACTOR 9, mitochondrial-like n=1 Tax=Oryza glaberrima TaxID=4538 RepID=UPI00224C3F0A|nr:protein WHAT'S THIS FACTOR 9, mitochondrial-like [Oryza glaberrima]